MKRNHPDADLNEASTGPHSEASPTSPKKARHKPWWVKVLLALALVAILYLLARYLVPLLEPLWRNLHSTQTPTGYYTQAQLNSSILYGLGAGFVFTLVPLLLLIPVFANRTRWLVTSIAGVLVLATALPWMLSIDQLFHGGVDAFWLTAIITGAVTLVVTLAVIIFALAFIRRGHEIEKLRAGLAHDLPEAKSPSKPGRHAPAADSREARDQRDAREEAARDVPQTTSLAAGATSAEESGADYSDWMSQIDKHSPDSQENM